MSTATPDFSAFTGEIYETWEKSMTQWWDQVLESPAVLENMGKLFSDATRARSTYEESVDKGLEQLHLPTRQDLLRVARIASLLEDRQLALEDRLLSLEDRLVDMEKEALKARVDAAETRLMVEDRLSSIDHKLDALLAPKEKPAKAPRKRRTRKTSEEG